MNTSKILQKLVLVGIFIVPFISFFVSKTMLFPFITGKGFAFRILIEIVFGIWVILALKDPVYRPKMTKISWSLIVFMGVMFLANIFGENPYKSFWSNYERMEGFVAIAHLVMYYFVVSSTLNTERLWNYFWNTNLIGSFIMSIYGLLQITGKLTINQGGVRVDGTLGNATYLAIYLVFNIFIGLWFLYKNYKNYLFRCCYLISVALNLIVLYFTATRGAILGLILGIGVFSVSTILYNKDNLVLKKVAKYSLLVLVVLLVLFMSLRNTSFIKNSPVLSRFSSISVSEIKNQGRWFVWPMAIEGFKERPILGWGQENFNYVFNKNYDPRMYNQEQWFDRTHNVVLDWLIAGGLLGLLSYLSIFFFSIYYLIKKTTLNTTEKSLLLGLFVAYFFHNLFVFDNLISYILFFSFVAFINSDSVKNKQYSNKTINEELVNYGLAPAVLILTCLLVYFVNIPAMMQSRSIIKSITFSFDQNGAKYYPNVSENLASIKKAFAYDSFGTSEALEQSAILTSEVAQMNFSNDIKQQFVALTYEQAKKQVSETPKDVRYLLLYGSFLNRFGLYDEALSVIQKAIELSPNKPAIYLELGSIYLGKGDVQKALDTFELAYKIEPRFKESSVVYAVASIYAGRQDLFTKIIASISEEDFVTDNRFLRAFIDVKNYNVAIGILEKRLIIDPQNYKNNTLYLATIYAQIGNKSKAIQLLKGLIEKDPKFKEQGEFYIKELSK